jgi:hypothetical protein
MFMHVTFLIQFDRWQQLWLIYLKHKLTKLLSRYRLASNRKHVEKEPKKPHKLFDDFLEIGVFDICNLTERGKKMAECFMNKILTSVEKESYDLLLHILKKEMCNISHDYQTIVHVTFLIQFDRWQQLWLIYLKHKLTKLLDINGLKFYTVLIVWIKKIQTWLVRCLV